MLVVLLWSSIEGAKDAVDVEGHMTGAALRFRKHRVLLLSQMEVLVDKVWSMEYFDPMDVNLIGYHITNA